ncbi:SGNH/GDSL hydrolase family protein [Spiractinospora alimapuensis]|uniref:SGNH/GDSL hydrolase family protein n=1 Tax=Spiractinospora alimapuensis TaxID=2820884 RepID=UPI001F33EF38|nr:SGNH/GDSL hydrolase family protein [Spiractinospora alimapuensis]QVQ53594.1 SGNH/GDSL hydrolase family protein [Spiractinospora alimapuensis]
MNASSFAPQLPDSLAFVAIGDSFTEGLSDPGVDGAFRGWADRVAEGLAGHVTDLRYANLAVRGKLVRQIVGEQVPEAIALNPDLVALSAGGNDIIRPGGDPDRVARVFESGVARLRAAGARVLICTGGDLGWQPVMRHLRGRVATYNMHLWGIAQKYDCSVVDLWWMRVLQDGRAWSGDRLHLSADGHRRVALRALEVLGVTPEEDWRAPLPPDEPVAWSAARQEDLRWAREYLVPWVRRRIQGVSSGDGRAAKRPTLGPLR